MHNLQIFAWAVLGATSAVVVCPWAQYFSASGLRQSCWYLVATSWGNALYGMKLVPCRSETLEGRTEAYCEASCSCSKGVSGASCGCVSLCFFCGCFWWLTLEIWHLDDSNMFPTCSSKVTYLAGLTSRESVFGNTIQEEVWKTAGAAGCYESRTKSIVRPLDSVRWC